MATSSKRKANREDNSNPKRMKLSPSNEKLILKQHKEIETLNKEIETLNKVIKGIEEKVIEAKEDVKEAKKDVNKAEEKVVGAALVGTYNDVFARAVKKLASLEDTRDAKIEQKEDLEAELKQMLRELKELLSNREWSFDPKAGRLFILVDIVPVRLGFVDEGGSEEYPLSLISNENLCPKSDSSGVYKRVATLSGLHVYFYCFSETTPASSTALGKSITWDYFNKIAPPVQGNVVLIFHIPNVYISYEEMTSFKEECLKKEELEKLLEEVLREKLEPLESFEKGMEKGMDKMIKMCRKVSEDLKGNELSRNEAFKAWMKKQFDEDFEIMCNEKSLNSLKFTKYHNSKADFSLVYKNSQITALSIQADVETDESFQEIQEIHDGLVVECKNDPGPTTGQDQLLACMMKLAGDMAHRTVTSNHQLFTKITVYGLLVNYKILEVRCMKLTLDFKEKTSSVMASRDSLGLVEGFQRMIALLKKT